MATGIRRGACKSMGVATVPTVERTLGESLIGVGSGLATDRLIDPGPARTEPGAEMTDATSLGPGMEGATGWESAESVAMTDATSLGSAMEGDSGPESTKSVARVMNDLLTRLGHSSTSLVLLLAVPDME